ncbi:MAG TPA: hypothetical protein DCF63_10190 [Planctomycetaceae bacterium]|nr:hypothetical protein [Planctomycetaceae bacterium]
MLDALGWIMRRRKSGIVSPKLKYAAIVTTARNEADAHKQHLNKKVGMPHGSSSSTRASKALLATWQGSVIPDFGRNLEFRSVNLC